MNNGIWIEEWAKSLGITEPVNGTWLQAIKEHYGGEDVNGTHLMSILHQMGGDMSNGTILKGIMEDMGRSMRNGSIPAGIGNLGDTSPSVLPTPPTPPTPPIDPCSIISGVTTDNIGKVGNTRLYYSWYKLYNYNNMGWTYTQSEIGDCKTITGIEIMTKSASYNQLTWANQKVYLAHIEEPNFQSQSTYFNLFNDNNITDLTLVYDGTFEFSGVDYDYMLLDFDTNFTFNGTDNLLVMIIDESGDFSYSYPAFRGIGAPYLYTGNGNTYPAFYDYSDSVLDIYTDNVTKYNYRPNTKLLY
jgi:hypothetical protein